MGTAASSITHKGGDLIDFPTGTAPVEDAGMSAKNVRVALNADGSVMLVFRPAKTGGKDRHCRLGSSFDGFHQVYNLEHDVPERNQKNPEAVGEWLAENWDRFVGHLESTDGMATIRRCMAGTQRMESAAAKSVGRAPPDDAANYDNFV